MSTNTIHICSEEFPYENTYQSYFHQYAPLTLSSFQKWAIKAIVDGDNVLITAHTGSGKTLPAEFAINFFKAQHKKVIYASPIKALSNQKLYDMRRKYPHISFGLLTGDCKDNPEADVLIMTTEILRNTLFNRKNRVMEECLSFNINVDEDLAAVIFDEVHYINDPERGSVWEQSIILLPAQVQLVMLSATIDRPEAFASWIWQEKHLQAIEELKTVKNMYLASTDKRVVPLTHYMWLTVNRGTIKKSAKTPYEAKLEAVNNIPLIIADSNGVYNDKNYHKVKEILDYTSKHNIYVKREFVLDNLIRYLKLNNMLPAICFIFSRKHVEQAANECSFSLHDDTDTNIITVIEKECRHILSKKLVNYKEYLELSEFHTIIRLLEKGIAIHHAGMMPVLREMVELLFEKGYIKLLFATETFAVGINMPTKTVIFSGLTKFNGTGMRLLYPHEYTQMAGRAGRRGIDTVGHVIHCNNLFENPSCIDYKHLLTGPPQKLTSKFKISFNLALNVYAANSANSTNVTTLEYFTNKSLLSSDIKKELIGYNTEHNRLLDTLKQKELLLSICKTPTDVLYKYTELNQTIETTTNSARKKLRLELNLMEASHKFLLADLKYVEEVVKVKTLLKENTLAQKNESEYITYVIKCVEKILIDNDFLTHDKVLTPRGLVASHLHEIHPLVLADTYIATNGFAKYSAVDIACIFSYFNNIKVNDELKACKPYGDNIISSMYEKLDHYYDLETKHFIDTGSSYDFNFDLKPYIMKWFAAADEPACKLVIESIKLEKNIFLGEFIKAILKINNICAEFENICELNGNIGLLEKIREIPRNMLKYVVTNQSLYL